MEYIRKIMELLAEMRELDEEDIIFARQIYTMIKRYIERKRKSR